MKRFSIYLLTILTIVSLLIVFSSGCSRTVKDTPQSSSDKISEKEKETESTQEKLEAQTSIGFPSGFPSSVPIYPYAVILDSSKSQSEGKQIYLVKLECSGGIEEVSEWYKGSLEKKWNLGSVSSGDMGTWSEFYAEAQTDEYFITVYLYQDEGSNKVSLDINVNEKAVSPADTTISDDEESLVQVSEESLETSISTSQNQQSGIELENAKIAFVCASVGSAWNIGQHFPQLNIQVYDEYQFDKGYRIQEILNSDKPDIMIIKECAAYFPPDSQGTSMEDYQNLIRDWVNLVQGQNVIVVLTTVVSIDPNNPSNQEGSRQLDSILEFNDWIKQYCSDEDISVLDLEKALHISDSNRALNPIYDSGDGLHPNDIAYSEKLDAILFPALERAFKIGY